MATKSGPGGPLLVAIIGPPVHFLRDITNLKTSVPWYSDSELADSEIEKCVDDSLALSTT